MNNFIVEQLIDPDDKDMAGVLNLFKGIPGRSCSAAAYLEYLSMNWADVALFVIRKNGDILGFTQAEAPRTLEPKYAWLPYSHATPQCPHREAVKAFKMAVEWMKGLGATKLVFVTTRNTKAATRLWKAEGVKRSKYAMMEKDIS